MSKLNQQFHLPDGRRLGYDEYGAPDGKPILYLHGSPSSRLEAKLYLSEDLLQSLDVRLIAVDRPGMGLSDFQPNRRLLDFPKDLVALADCLKIERFAILAYSLGGPYGLACGFAIPDRLTKAGIVSGAALFTEPELMMNINEGTRKFLTMPREKPLLSRLFLWMMLGVMPRLASKKFIAGAAAVLPETDRAVVEANADFQSGFIQMVREATRQGTRGAFHESLLSITDYGFRLQDIRTPLQFWHGEADKNIPVEMARFAASAIPKCEAKFYPDEGHLSLFKKHAAEIIRALV
ncbi:MAG: alpha/beta hydrolase [Chloroflexi bacterium]|nr:alpha/beta hydrolase [Chloroflexota bacterium]